MHLNGVYTKHSGSINVKIIYKFCKKEKNKISSVNAMLPKAFTTTNLTDNIASSSLKSSFNFMFVKTVRAIMATVV